jgi:hypothetical protein
MNLTETQDIRYRVVCEGNVLLESVSKTVAEQFVSTLNRGVQERVQIVPITDQGLQVLLG